MHRMQGRRDVAVVRRLQYTADARQKNSKLDLSSHLNPNAPNVGTVESTSPMCNLYRIVVFPAASNPNITTRISLFPNSLSNACLKDLTNAVVLGELPMVALLFVTRGLDLCAHLKFTEGGLTLDARVASDPYGSMYFALTTSAAKRKGRPNPARPDLAPSRLT